MRNTKPYNLEPHELNIIGGSKFGRYEQQTTEDSVNLMVGVSGDKPSLIPTPGHKKVLSFPQGGPAREIFRSTLFDRLIVVFGRHIYTVSKSLSYGLIGKLFTDSGIVKIAENLNNEIAIVDGTNRVYLFNFGLSTFTVVPLDFRAIYIDFHDGYFLAAVGGTASYRLSGLNDGTTWDNEEESNIQTKADRMVAVIEFGRQIFLIGEKRIDIAHDLARLDFPYVRDNTISIPYGCVSADTISVMADVKNKTKLLVFLAANEKSNPTLVYSTGGQIESISLPGLDAKFESLTHPENSSGFLFSEDNHVLYQLVFPDDDFSFIYDFTTGHYYRVTDEKLCHHIARRYAFFNGQDYFIPTSGAALYEMGTDITTYDGETIPRIRITAPLRNTSDDFYILRKISLQIEHGETKLPSRIDLSISKDGGKSYGSVITKDMRPSASPRGKFNYWNLGSANDMRLQFRFWSKERFVLTDSSIEIMQ